MVGWVRLWIQTPYWLKIEARSGVIEITQHKIFHINHFNRLHFIQTRTAAIDMFVLWNTVIDISVVMFTAAIHDWASKCRYTTLMHNGPEQAERTYGVCPLSKREAFDY